MLLTFSSRIQTHSPLFGQQSPDTQHYHPLFQGATPKDVYFGSTGQPKFNEVAKALKPLKFSDVSLCLTAPRRVKTDTKTMNTKLSVTDNGKDRARQIVINGQVFTGQLLQVGLQLPKIVLTAGDDPTKTITLQLKPDKTGIAYTDLSGQTHIVERVPTHIQRVFDMAVRFERNSQFWRDNFDQIIQQRLDILDTLLKSGVMPTHINTNHFGSDQGSTDLSFDFGNLHCRIDARRIYFTQGQEESLDKAPTSSFSWSNNALFLERIRSMDKYNSLHYTHSDGKPVDDFYCPETMIDEAPNTEIIDLLNRMLDRLQAAAVQAQTAQART